MDGQLDHRPCKVRRFSPRWVVFLPNDGWKTPPSYIFSMLQHADNTAPREWQVWLSRNLMLLRERLCDDLQTFDPWKHPPHIEHVAFEHPANIAPGDFIVLRWLNVAPGVQQNTYITSGVQQTLSVEGLYSLDALREYELILIPHGPYDEGKLASVVEQRQIERRITERLILDKQPTPRRVGYRAPIKLEEDHNG